VGADSIREKEAEAEAALAVVLTEHWAEPQEAKAAMVPTEPAAGRAEMLATAPVEVQIRAEAEVEAMIRLTGQPARSFLRGVMAVALTGPVEEVVLVQTEGLDRWEIEPAEVVGVAMATHSVERSAQEAMA
jgi:hypothetical protein